MKKLLFISLLSFLNCTVNSQITGGELTYDYSHAQGQYNFFFVTLKLFKNCNSSSGFPSTAIVSVFEKTSKSRFNDFAVQITDTKSFNSNSTDPCIGNPTALCYDVAYYTFPLTLPFNTNGYLLASQVNYRVSGITNLSPVNTVANYTADIPDFNESPVFRDKDVILICANKSFSYDVAAVDLHDTLRYSFCEAFTGTANSTGIVQPSAPPPFIPVVYNSPQFTATFPLGPGVQINPVTGVISGIAPAAGNYLVTVGVDETRNNPNQFSVRQRKELLVKVVNCTNGSGPLISYRDTLICKNDNLLLHANGTGIFNWSPSVNIINANSADPTVSPGATMVYYVDLDDNGCHTRDSVKVNVVNNVTVQAMSDTIICKGDTIQIRVQSDGLRYAWSPATQLINSTSKNPFAITSVSTNYQVIASIGGCLSVDDVFVTAVPYPSVNAGRDTTICFNTQVQLHGVTDGSSWLWSPALLVDNAGLLDPVAFPKKTTQFALTVFDNMGCPKPRRDTIILTVFTKMNVSAGRDTAVIINQPLQLQASGGINYNWLPGNELSDATIPNPVGIFANPSTGIHYKLMVFDSNGCKDSAYLTIKVFKSPPTVFVPSGFTPNGDGKNDILRPIAAGITGIEYFNLYNRWGQLIFSSKGDKGWDGKINGVMQYAGTFVWEVKAIDYSGKSYFQKGMVTLIR